MARTTARRKTARRKTVRGKTVRRKGTRYWSGRVTRESDALDLEGGVFKGRDPKRIAASLKRSAERSRRRKSDPYRSAISMLTFYINRAGKVVNIHDGEYASSGTIDADIQQYALGG